QAALLRRSAHAGPGGRLFGDRVRAVAARAQGGVELAQEMDRLVVLATAMYIRNPLAVPAAVVPVEHRGHRIDAQRVGVEALDPFERARDEEPAHLVAPEIVYIGVPVRMVAFARVGVLVERRAVEAREAVRVRRKMRRYPVEDHADALGVTAVDERGELGRRAVLRGRREL